MMTHELSLSMNHHWTVRTSIIELIRGKDHPYTVEDIADLTGRSRSRIQRVLNTMLAKGEVRRVFGVGSATAWELLP
jgi:DNA-binding MarR family transcriptional regulator